MTMPGSEKKNGNRKRKRPRLLVESGASASSSNQKRKLKLPAAASAAEAFGSALSSFMSVVIAARSPSLKRWTEKTASRAYGWAEYIEAAAKKAINSNEKNGVDSHLDAYARQAKIVSETHCVKFNASLEALATGARALLLRSILFSSYLTPTLAPWVKRAVKKIDPKGGLGDDILAWQRMKRANSAFASSDASRPYPRRMSTVRKLTDAVCLRIHVAQALRLQLRGDKKGAELLAELQTYSRESKEALEIVCMAMFAEEYLGASSARKTIAETKASPTKPKHLDASIATQLACDAKSKAPSFHIETEPKAVDGWLLSVLLPFEDAAVSPSWRMHPWILAEAAEASFPLAAAYVSHLVCLMVWNDWQEALPRIEALWCRSANLRALLKGAVNTPDGTLKRNILQRINGRGGGGRA